MKNHAKVNTTALLQAVDKTIAQLKDEYHKGMLDIGRYSQLSTTFATFKAEIEQLAEYERAAANYTHETIPTLLRDDLQTQQERVEKLRGQLPSYGEFARPTVLSLPRWAWVLGAIIALGVVIVGGVYLLSTFAPGVIPAPQPTLAVPKAQEDEILVLIAEFKGAGQIQPAQLLQDNLRTEIAQLDPPILTARIESAPDVITDQDAARELGERYNATIVIWGWYDNLNFKPNFAIIKGYGFEFQDLELERQQVSLATPDELTFAYINTQMPAQMNYFTLFTIGQIYYWDKQFDAALVTIELAIAWAEISETTKGLATAYFHAGYIYQVIREDITATLQAYNTAIELNSDYAVVYNNRGSAYNDLGEYARAIEDFDTAFELNPELAEAYNNRGNAYAGLGEYTRAIQDYDTALELDPDDAETYYSRGNAYADLGEYARAIQDYDTALELDPEYAEVYTNRGIAYAHLGEYARAIQDFDTTLELNPELAKPYTNRGAAYAALGEYDRAIQDCDTALELDPDDAVAYTNRGIAYDDLGEYARAIQDYDTALDLDPKYAIAYNNRGNAYRALGEYARAIQDYDTALELDPDYAAAYYNRGNAYYNMGEYARAIQDYDTALELNPELAEAYGARGVAYMALDKKEKAIADLEKFLTLTDNPELRELVKEVLEELRGE